VNIAGEITTGASTAPFHGPPARWAEELTDLAVAQGFDTFVLWAEGPGQLERFAEEIAPAVREQIAAERHT
jgi:hypothetical protein